MQARRRVVVARALGAAAHLAHLTAFNIQSGYVCDTDPQPGEPRIVDSLHALGGVSTLRTLIVRGEWGWGDACIAAFRTMSHLDTIDVVLGDSTSLERLLAAPLPPHCAW